MKVENFTILSLRSSWKNGILMYHKFNEGKALVLEWFNRTLKNIKWKHYTNKYLDVLPSIREKI